MNVKPIPEMLQSFLRSAANTDVGTVAGAIVPDKLVDGISRETTESGVRWSVPDSLLHPTLNPPTLGAREI